MSILTSLDEYVVFFDIAAEDVGAAEFEALLCALLTVELEDLDEALGALPAARLVRLLHGESDPATRLRTRLRMLDRKTTGQALAQALARRDAEGAPLRTAMRAALLAFSARAPLSPQERLVHDVQDARDELIDLWPEAFDCVARWGEIDQPAAWRLGIGSEVWAGMCAQLGRPADAGIAREEFCALAPRLVEFWPLTQDGLGAIRALLRVVRITLANGQRGDRPHLNAVH